MVPCARRILQVGIYEEGGLLFIKEVSTPVNSEEVISKRINAAAIRVREELTVHTKLLL